MLTTITIDELAFKVLSPEVERAFLDVEIGFEEAPSELAIMTVDEFAKQTLDITVEQAFPDIDIEELESGSKIRKSQMFTNVRGLSITLVLNILATLLVNAVLLLF